MCKFCEDRNNKYEIENATISIDNDNCLVIAPLNYYSNKIYLTLDYCPMCGKKLCGDK